MKIYEGISYLPILFRNTKKKFHLSLFFPSFSLGVVDAIQDLIHAKYMPELHFCPLQVELFS